MRGLEKTAPDGADGQTDGHGDSKTNSAQRTQVGEKLEKGYYGRPHLSMTPLKKFVFSVSYINLSMGIFDCVTKANTAKNHLKVMTAPWFQTVIPQECCGVWQLFPDYGLQTGLGWSLQGQMTRPVQTTGWSLQVWMTQPVITTQHCLA